ncbi:DnaJ-domain-containing protein [Violaceomyces palustris]|uniref:DnaJ-domain-containing protein n=1 Tax=Violaceomyces palustris TaxID=1673888 RepID=A0ACD0NN99_9BASI|nr:DnaJ-domain-containing protein [Violaceomyces palustris]
MTSNDETSLEDSFSILGLTYSATEQEIKKSYRKLSLKFHPDKVSKDVDPVKASEVFHRLNRAYELLMDPSSRAKASRVSKEEEERKRRKEAFDGKRKAMADQLERDERESSRKRFEADKARLERESQIQNIKEEARRLREERRRKDHLESEMREEKRKAYHQAFYETRSNPELEEDGEVVHAKADGVRSLPDQALRGKHGKPDLGPLDCSVRLKFPSIRYFQLSAQAREGGGLTGEEQLSSRVYPPPHPDQPLDTILARSLERSYGRLESLLFQPPKSEKKRESSALATFTHLKDAWRSVIEGGQLRCSDQALEDVWIGWAGTSSTTGKDKSKKGGKSSKSDVEPVIRVTEKSDKTLGKGDKSHDAEDQVKVYDEPERVSWYKSRGILSPDQINEEQDLDLGGEATTFPSEEIGLTSKGLAKDSNNSIPSAAAPATAAPPPRFSFSANAFSTTQRNQGLDVDFESSTLQRLREAERRRMEEEIKRREEEEEGG